MEIKVIEIKLRNLLFVLVLIVSILIMSNYFQQSMEAYIKNNIFRWGTAIALSFVMLCILYNNPLFKVDSNHKELNVSEENVIKQDELDLLDVKESDDKHVNRQNYKYIRGRQIRFFTLEEFDGNLAQGYIKLKKGKKGLGLGVHVIDTYNSESKEEAENYINSGFIKVGYQSKFDFD